MKITLDNNCLISLQNKDGEFSQVKSLIDLHESGRITLYIPAIAASENQQGDIIHDNFIEFQRFLAEIGCDKCELLMSMGYTNISYLNYAVTVNTKMVSLERQIHDILFPNIPFRYSDYCQRFGLNPNIQGVERKWRNAKCDVQAMWWHIYYNNDIFVTEDGNFHKKTKKSRLITLGAKAILKPNECLSELEKKGII